MTKRGYEHYDGSAYMNGNGGNLVGTVIILVLAMAIATLACCASHTEPQPVMDITDTARPHMVR